MGIFSKLFGNKDPIESMKKEDLRLMEIKLNRKIEELQAEVREIENEVSIIFEKAKSKRSKNEELMLARRIKTLSQRKEMITGAQSKLDKELRAISNILILKEHKADLQATGIWDQVRKLEPEKLEKWLVTQNLEAQDRDDVATSLIDITSTAMLTGVDQEEDLDDILGAIRVVKEDELELNEADEFSSIIVGSVVNPQIPKSAIKEGQDIVTRYKDEQYNIETFAEETNECSPIKEKTPKTGEKTQQEGNSISFDKFENYRQQNADCVNFTLTAPSVMTQGNNYEICVWAYLNEQEQRMREEAQKFHDTENLIEKSKKSVPVQRRSTIMVFLDIPDFNIDDPLDTIYWDEDVANASFIVGIPADNSIGRHKGKVILRIEGLQIAKLDFMLSVGIEEMKDSSVVVNQTLVNSAFASYAREDRNEVLARIQGIQKVRPDMDIFMDVVSLRSGDYWEIRLTEEIKKRDIFYLFWSEASSKSVYVNKEWHTALESKGIDFISPVPLVSPAEVPPPQELASLHFNDWILAFRSYHP